MKRRIIMEWKTAGPDFLIISTALTAVLLIFSVTAGELIDFYPVVFEVIFPFYAGIAVGEWGKTRADDNFDVIAAQGKSVFLWAVLRYVVVFGTVCFFALICMAGAGFLRNRMAADTVPVSFGEMFLMFFPTAFFLSSLCALVGMKCRQEHVASLTGGVVWLTALLTRGCLRFPGVEYIYPFICFAGDENHVRLWNKGILTAAGGVIWLILWITEEMKSIFLSTKNCQVGKQFQR